MRTSLLSPIDDRELRAWAYLAPEEDAARSGPLADLDCGIKDVIDVARMPTAFGVDFHRTNPERDAWCVAHLREAGAAIRGKTQTTPFAFRDPPVTRNPWNPERTPGGSSSGSAVAVAAGHVAFAIGTQTLGSVLRPASFCGVVGFKPTFGAVLTEGVAPLASSLDHVGVLARDVATLTRVACVLQPDLKVSGPYPPRLRVDLALNAELYGEPARAAAQKVLETCLERGATLSRSDVAPLAARAIETAGTILEYEAHRSLHFLLDEPRTPSSVAALIHRGAAVKPERYEAARAQREAMRAELPALFEGCDALALLCVGPAPPRDTTGDPAGQTPWTFFGLPSISIPIGRDADGLPLSIQLVAQAGSDGSLLALSSWVERSIAAETRPTALA